MLYIISFVVFIVQSLRCVQLFAIPWPIECQAPLSSSTSQGLLTFMPTESMMLSNHLILCCPLLLLPSIFPSIRVFSNESALLTRWPKYCSFSMSPSNKCLALISFRIDQFDLLAVQGTLKSLLQHHRSKVSIQSILPLHILFNNLKRQENEDVSWCLLLKSKKPCFVEDHCSEIFFSH